MTATLGASRRWYLASLSLSIACAMLAGCTPQVSEGLSSDWARYESPGGDYTLSYPGNFAVGEFDGHDVDPEGLAFEPGDVSFVLFASDGKPSLAGGAALFSLGGEFKPSEVKLSVSIIKTSMPWDSAEEAAEFLREQNSGYAGYHERSFAPKTVDGEPAFDLVYDAEGELTDGTKVSQTVHMLIFIHNGWTYMISAGAFTTTYDEQVDQLDRFLESVALS